MGVRVVLGGELSTLSTWHVEPLVALQVVTQWVVGKNGSTLLTQLWGVCEPAWGVSFTSPPALSALRTLRLRCLLSVC